MSFETRITRWPHVHEAEFGRDALDRFSAAGKATGSLVAGAAGSSPFLRGLIASEADWLEAALAAGPERALADILDGLAGGDMRAIRTSLRVARRRVALLVALADLGGLWTLEETTGALTDFADRATGLAFDTTVAAEIARGRIPGIAEGGAAATGLFVLAMGKMGARELNYSSDIDLIVLFDEGRYDRADYPEARSALIRATRNAVSILSETTAEGYVFRTDLRLRPDAAVTPVCMSMTAAEDYYESVGRTWERAAYIKARVCAGDQAAGAGFLERLSPFVWRRYLDFVAIQDAHEMRTRIREHKGLLAGSGLDGRDLKLASGGIREIEFFTQTRQIIAGGREPALRVRGTVEGLQRLAEGDWITEETAQTLIADYRAHREIEHRLQMIHDAQTHALPKTGDGWARLAALCGRDRADLTREIAARIERVADLTEGFFGGRRGETTDAGSIEGGEEIMARWQAYPAFRSARAGEIFERLRPEIIKRLNRAARPLEALRHFDQFLAGLPAGVQVFSLFEANPQLVELVIDIAATSPELAGYLGRNSGVFDAVIGGDFFAPWPGTEALANELSGLLARQPDYEAQLDLARVWAREWHFRTGVHFLRGLIDAEQSGAEYASLAEAVLQALWPVVQAAFAERHGVIGGAGAALLGMGSLGARRLTATSDLDLIVIYQPGTDELSSGPRQIGPRHYFARLTQALVTALSAQTAEGRLYEVDMRLRPSGRQGPVATSLDAFRDYQANEAWTWEHLALTRARVVAGDEDIASALDDFRGRLVGQGRDAGKVIADTADMRERLDAARSAAGKWDAKTGPGRLQDIALFAQAAALVAGSTDRAVAGQLAAARSLGWIDDEELSALIAADRLFWSLPAASRLLTTGPLDPDTAGRAGCEFILRATGAASLDELAQSLQRSADAVSGIIDRVMNARPAGSRDEGRQFDDANRG